MDNFIINTSLKNDLCSTCKGKGIINPLIDGIETSCCICAVCSGTGKRDRWLYGPTLAAAELMKAINDGR